MNPMVLTLSFGHCFNCLLKCPGAVRYGASKSGVLLNIRLLEHFSGLPGSSARARVSNGL